MEIYGILKVKNRMVNFVYCVRDCTFCNLDIFLFYVIFSFQVLLDRV
jgi:hypothetical protein